jgi:integrase
MATLKTVADGFVSVREYDNATLGRIAFWVNELGDRELAEITAEEVDKALVLLAERGRLKSGRNLTTIPLGQPLAGSTLNRYIGQLASIYKYARRLRLLPRMHVPPTKGIEKAPENSHPDRYLRPEEVERIIKVARVVDQRWGRMAALIATGFCTGLRKTNLLELRWRDVDLAACTVSVLRTKNGQPIVSALSSDAVRELSKLNGRNNLDAYVFEGRVGKPYDIRRLWAKVCSEAGMAGRNFHQLRHGCGHALAMAGTNQATIMQVMGHRSLTASARYMHANAEDKKRVIGEVFG